jgi:hypothetical protein
MKPYSLRIALVAGSALLATCLPVCASAQAPGNAPGGRGPQGPRCAGDVEQLPDNRVTFRFCAPNAQSVAVTGDLFVPASAFTKGEAGL